MTARVPFDAEIVLAARRGDAEAWEALVHTWLPVVHGWCTRLGGPRVDPADAVQDIFIVLFTRLADLRDSRSFPSWIFGTTRRVLWHHRQKAWIRRWLPGSPKLGATRHGPEQVREASELKIRIQELLERLPASQRDVLVLCDVEGRTSVEVAALLDVPEGTVRSRLRLGRERFRTEAQNLDVTAELLTALAGGEA
jgi:RNA polymerase sigma-70 factor, ECF subfamily